MAEPRPVQRRAFDIEQALGTNWLGKLGVIILVLGIVIWLALQVPKLTAGEKLAAAYVAGALLLVGGVALEKRWNYALLGRTTAGGGWALIYFTTYAMYFVQATKILNSQALDLTFLLLVAGAMVAHTLRYDSQTATAIAFLLGFVTVTISRDTVYGLTASVVLAAGLVAVVLYRRWYELEVFGILSSYLNHLLWLRTIIEPMGGRRHAFPEFTASTLLLFFYWAVFRVSYIARRKPSGDEEKVSTLAALLNVGLLLGLLRYQSVHPELAFWALLGLGAAELGLGQFPGLRKGRRLAFLVLTTVGLALLVAAVPFRYSGSNLSVLWLVEGEALFLLGVMMREAVFRHFGALAAVLTAGNLLLFQTVAVYDRRAAGHGEAPEYQLAVLCVLATLVFYANTHGVFRRWSQVFESGFEQGYLALLSYLGGLLALVGAWLAFPGVWTGVAWAALALVLAVAGSVLKETPLALQADASAVLSTVWIFLNNLEATQSTHGMTQRLVTMSVAAVLLYTAARWRGRGELAFSAMSSASYTWLGTTLLAVLAFKELPDHWVAVTWAALALVLLVLCRMLARMELRWQAHCLAVAALFGCLAWNFGAAGMYHGVSVRLLSVAAVAAVFYVSTRWIKPDEFDYAEYVHAAYSWAGSGLLAGLMWYELRPVSVAVGWTVFGLLLYELGWIRSSASLRLQAYALYLISFVRLFFVNLNAASPPGELSPRLYTVLPLAAAFYYVSWRSGHTPESEQALEQRLQASDWHNYLGAITVAALLRFEVPPDWVAAGWAAMVLVLMAVAWRRGRNVYLFQGLLLAAGVVFRAAFYNFELPHYYPQSPSAGALTTVGAAAALLLLSLPFAFGVREKQKETPSRFAPARRPEQALFFLPVGMITVLLALEMRKGLITLSWGMEGVLVFLLALWIGERSFRLTGLGLLLLCVGKLAVVDFWDLPTNEKYLTCIALGAALILVSYLYTRFQESFRRYL